MRVPEPRERPWLSVAEVAQITGEGEKVIRAALEAGQLPRLDIGRYVRIPTAGLLALVGITPEDSESPAATAELIATTATPTHGGPREHDATAPECGTITPLRNAG